MDTFGLMPTAPAGSPGFSRPKPARVKMRTLKRRQQHHQGLTKGYAIASARWRRSAVQRLHRQSEPDPDVRGGRS
jgi:hypothetical protein